MHEYIRCLKYEFVLCEYFGSFYKLIMYWQSTVKVSASYNFVHSTILFGILALFKPTAGRCVSSTTHVGCSRDITFKGVACCVTRLPGSCVFSSIDCNSCLKTSLSPLDFGRSLLPFDTGRVRSPFVTCAVPLLFVTHCRVSFVLGQSVTPCRVQFMGLNSLDLGAVLASLDLWLGAVLASLDLWLGAVLVSLDLWLGAVLVSLDLWLGAVRAKASYSSSDTSLGSVNPCACDELPHAS